MCSKTNNFLLAMKFFAVHVDSELNNIEQIEKYNKTKKITYKKKNYYTRYTVDMEFLLLFLNVYFIKQILIKRT